MKTMPKADINVYVYIRFRVCLTLRRFCLHSGAKLRSCINSGHVQVGAPSDSRVKNGTFHHSDELPVARPTISGNKNIPEL